MNPIRGSARALFLVIGMLTALVVPVGTANATSIYDTTYKSIAISMQKGYYGCADQDITYGWSNYLTNDEFAGVKESFALAKSQGRWGVSVSWGQVEVFWTEDTSLYLDWMDPVYGGGYSVMAKGNGVHRAEFSLSGYYYPKPCIPYVSSYWVDASDVVIADKFGNIKNLFVITDHLNYPPGYEGVLILTTPPPAKYVAMGDSFSSGEGNPPFEAGTGTGGVNECHRSPLGYPRLLQADVNIRPMAFVACAGATTDTILYGASGLGSWNEGPQVDAISAVTERVTITMGGNNIKFPAFAHACVMSYCDAESDEYQESWDIMTNPTNSGYLPPKLTDVLEAIQGKLTTASVNAKVYVIGYPKVITHDSWNSAPLSNCLYWTEGSVEAAEGIVEKLDELIEDSVTNLNDPRFTFVDPLELGSLFIGHELCRSDNYFNGVNVTQPDAYTFHPNEGGHGAFETLVLNEM